MIRHVTRLAAGALAAAALAIGAATTATAANTAPGAATTASTAGHHVFAGSPFSGHATAPQAISAVQGNPFTCDPGNVCDLQCSPSIQPPAPNGPFPLPGNQINGSAPGFPGAGCGTKTFSWGYTVSGAATGMAQWDSILVGPWCRAWAFVPDTNSNDPNAQYYIFDGSHYLANDAFFNQQNLTDQWGLIYSTGYFHVSDHLRVTLSDHNPLGQANFHLAADAMIFECHS